MKKTIPFRPKTTLVLLLTVIVVNACSIFILFPRIDTIVNVDLYNYGLQFDTAWYNPMWNNTNLFLTCLKIAIIMIALSAILAVAYARKHDAISKAVSTLLIEAGVGINIFSLYPLYWLDQVVNNDLYFFGLNFNKEWYTSYKLYYDQSVVIVLLASAIAVAAALLISLSARKTANLVSEKWADSILILGGITFLTLSVGITSSILALIGLGMIFWGLILTYIGSKEYVKKILLDTSTSSELAIANKIIQETDYAGNPIVFPPRYFKIPETYKAYIPKERNSRLPTLREIYKEDPGGFLRFMKEPPALLITPPGAELISLFEKTLKMKFSQMNPKHLMIKLPELLVEDLEMVQHFEMNIEEEVIQVRIEGSVYENHNPDEQQPVFFSFSSPLTSAIAYALASVFNKPVMVMKQRIDLPIGAVIIEYLIVREEESIMT